MKQLTHDGRNVAHMRVADRRDDSGSGAAVPPLVGRDSAGRFIAAGAAGGGGSPEAMARMKIGIPESQQQWVEEEAARRGVPKTAVVRELIDRALSGEVSRGGHARSAGGVESEAVVHDVPELAAASAGAAAAVAGGTRAGGNPAGRRDGGDARVPEVVDAEPSSLGGRHGGFRPDAYAGGHGRDPRYGDPGSGVPRAAASSGGGPHHADPSRRHEVVEERVAVDSVRRVVGGPVSGNSPAHLSHLPPGIGASAPRPEPGEGGHAVPASVDGGALEGLPPGVLPAGVHADVVSEGADSKSLVLSGGPVSSESGVVLMLPGERPGDPPRAVRIPLASYVKAQRGAAGGGFFGGLPRLLKYFLILFGVVSVLLGFVYLGSSFVASRYEFREVEIAPGRVIFYRVDRWTGEMERCRSSLTGFPDESGVAC